MIITGDTQVVLEEDITFVITGGPPSIPVVFEIINMDAGNNGATVNYSGIPPIDAGGA
jgi:hypothetical protein